MTYYALILLDKSGKILKDQPIGCQFDPQFLQNIALQESNNATPHPFAYEMGGGFWLHGLWSGMKPFIVSPANIVGIVADGNEDATIIKKYLRILTNNVLLSFKEQKEDFDNYFVELWNSIEQGQISKISLKKPKVVDLPGSVAINAPPSNNFLSNEPTPISESSSLSSENNFEDLLSLQSNAPVSHSEVNPSSHQSNWFEDDPFKSSEKPLIQQNRDPFGDTLEINQDPFGSVSTGVRDPFTGAILKKNNDNMPNSPTSTSKSPNFGDLSYNPSLFGNSSSDPIPRPVSDEIFEENPWNVPDSDFDAIEDLSLSDDPWATPKNKKKNSEDSDDTDVDPFSENPF